MSTRGGRNMVATGNRSFTRGSGGASGYGFTVLSSVRFTNSFGGPARCTVGVTHGVGFTNRNGVVIRHFNSLVHNEHAGSRHLSTGDIMPALGTFTNSLSVIVPCQTLAGVVRAVCTLSGMTPKYTGSSALLCNYRGGCCSVHPRREKGFSMVSGICLVNSNDNVAEKLSRDNTVNLCITSRVYNLPARTWVFC